MMNAYSLAMVSSSCFSSILHISRSVPIVNIALGLVPFSWIFSLLSRSRSLLLISFSFSFSLKICTIARPIPHLVFVRHVERVVHQLAQRRRDLRVVQPRKRQLLVP